MMHIRPIDVNDREQWLRLRCLLWPGDNAALEKEVDLYYSGELAEPEAVLVAEESGKLLGFVEVSIRPHAEGCHSRRAGYLEAWFVDQKVRRQGIGRSLVAAAEDWARNQGCTEFASDCEITNIISARAHLALGFEEVETIRCFRKTL